MTHTDLDTTILDLAAAVYEEALALVGPGEEADALSMAALAGLLDKAQLVSPRKATVARATHVQHHHRRPAALRATA